MKKLLFSMLCLFIAVGNITMYAQTGEEELTEEEKSGLVSFDFKDADIRNVLRIFSHKTGINIVASSDVVGNVTVKLNNVPWEKALKIILEMDNFAYVREGNVIKVLTRDRIAQEPLKTEVITLDYAKAAAVKTTVDTMITERGKVQVDERANLLIVTDIPSSFDPIMNVIKRLDLPTPQVLIESKIIETTLDVSEKFGIKWNMLDEFSLGTSAYAKTKSNSKTTTVNYGRDQGQDLGSFTEEWSHLYSDSLTDGNRYVQFGEDITAPADTAGYWATRSELPSYKPNDWVTTGGGFTKESKNIITNTLDMADITSTASSIVLNASGLNVVMSALMTDDGTDILSAPSIVTMDNIEAEIKVASDYPIPTYAYNEEIGRYEITGFTPTPIGITMKVTPKIAPNGYVTMNLNPEISTKELDVPFINLGASIPQIGKQNVKTTVMVKDGDTVVLGGLMKQNDVYNKQQVPLLHQIPVLGWLFKYKDKLVKKRNLMIFVTPTIVKKENATTITQNKSDEYTKIRNSFKEPTTVYPNLEE